MRWRFQSHCVAGSRVRTLRAALGARPIEHFQELP